jgi:hypothetical protein
MYKMEENMKRVTVKDLERIVNRLNELKGKPLEYFSINDEGQRRINIGHFTLSGAYGGWQLQQVVTDGGGIRVISNGGHIPKRELYNQLCAMIYFHSYTI